MKGQDFFELTNKGIYPTIKFLPDILDIDCQFETNMLAQVTSVFHDSENIIGVEFSEAQFSKYNKDLETPTIYNESNNEYDLRWSEIHPRKERGLVYICLTDDIPYFEIVDDNYTELVKEYVDSKTTLTYVEWLQEQVFMLRAMM